MKTTRRIILTLILISGLAGSVMAFVSTPKFLRVENTVLPCESVRSDVMDSCVVDPQSAALRGGGVLVLAVAAFAGAAVILKD